MTGSGATDLLVPDQADAGLGSRLLHGQSCCVPINQPAADGQPVIGLAGAPNVGKSTLFNALAGTRARVGNWPGTSVETSTARWRPIADAPECSLVDLPGTYSLDPLSPDEALTRDLITTAPGPDAVIVLVDAAHLARSLYLVVQLRELALRVVVALGMADVAAERGITVDPGSLAVRLGCPVIPVDPRRRRGLLALGQVVADTLNGPVPEPRVVGVPRLSVPITSQQCGATIAGQRSGAGLVQQVDAESARGVSAVADHRADGGLDGCADAGLDDRLEDGASDDDLTREDERFARVDAIVRSTVRRTATARTTWSDRLDHLVTHPVWGPLVLLVVMWLVFQATTTIASPLQDGLAKLITGPVADLVRAGLGAVGLAGSWLDGLLINGLIGGVGMVLSFVPLMAIMFTLLALLEDSGYLARAAVVTDRMMRTIGLPGQAFLPLVVGFGCNVPAIAATRVLPQRRQRVLTALLVPFTSCSARLTVYLLVSSVFFGRWAGTVVFGMYLASIVFVVLVGLALRHTLWRTMGDQPLVLDLPPYQRPTLRVTGAVAWSRLRGFLSTAGGIIIVTVCAVWLIQAIPVTGGRFGQIPVADSLYAWLSRTVAPLFAPLGFGAWQLVSALIVGFVAKEAVISSWAQTFMVADPTAGASGAGLSTALMQVFTTASGGHTLAAVLAFLVFLVAYTPCVATIAAQRREIGGRWTLFGLGVQLFTAWTSALIVFQVGRIVW